ncbi:MAG: alpha/beta hydrolase [Bacillota bacterium]
MYLKRMRDGYELFYMDEPVENPKGVVVITHGFAEHCSRYDYVSSYIRKEGFSVVRYDLRGHGRNKNRGHLEKFEDLVEDLREIVEGVSEKDSETPIITFGHSMGGLVTALFGVNYPEAVKAQVLSGPAVGKLPSAEKLQNGLVRGLSNIAGGIMLNNPVDEGICGKEGVYREYMNDPDVLHKASLRLYYQFLVKGADIMLLKAKDYRYPCLFVHGKEDSIVPIEISRHFYNEIPSHKKDLKEYDGLYHEILNEDARDKVLQDITAWIKELV